MPHSLRGVKYSWAHLFQAASMHLYTYLCCFFQLSLTSSSCRESSGNLISLPRIIEFVVNTEYSKSSSIYVNGWLFRLTSKSNNTSFNSDHVSNDLPMDLYRLFFVRPSKRSYCPPHHGALERLNFQIILSLLKKSWNFASLLILLNHFAPALKVFALSEYMMFGFPLLEINLLKLLINSVVVRFDTSSRCTALLTLHENNEIHALRWLAWLI